MNSDPNQVQFLQDTVLPELRKFTESDLEYYGFVIAMQVIEVVGSLFDTELLDEYGQAENRFQKGFEYLFPDPPYKGMWRDFFRDLRGPLVHQLRPGWTFTLSRESKNPKTDHFARDAQRQIVLIYETLVCDLGCGLTRLSEEIASGQLTGRIDSAKLSGRYLVTYNLCGSGGRTDTNRGLSAQPNFEIITPI